MDSTTVPSYRNNPPLAFIISAVCSSPFTSMICPTVSSSIQPTSTYSTSTYTAIAEGVTYNISTPLMSTTNKLDIPIGKLIKDIRYSGYEETTPTRNSPFLNHTHALLPPRATLFPSTPQQNTSERIHMFN